MPKAYMMVHLELTDPEAFMAGFGSKIETLANEFGGRFLVQMGQVHRYENQFNGKQADIHGIVEFPDKESAIAWYESDQHLFRHRRRSPRLTDSMGRIIRKELRS